jgi:hypothetical protein
VQVPVSNSDGSDTTATISVDRQSPTVGALTHPGQPQSWSRLQDYCNAGRYPKDYNIRCLPNGLPTWASPIGFCPANSFLALHDFQFLILNI